MTILTQADKLGKSIGYCSMELLNKKGELVARGKHIRYLQMGRPFDFITQSWSLPWTLKFYEMFYGKKTDSMATTGPTAGKGMHNECSCWNFFSFYHTKNLETALV